MDSYGFPYGPYPAMSPAGDQDRGDNMDYYSMQPMSTRDLSSPSKLRSHRHRSKRTPSATGSKSSKSRSKSRSRSQSITRSHSRSRSRSRSRSQSTRSYIKSPRRELNLKDPSFLDAFRVLYLTPSRTKRSTSKYLATKKRQDHIEEILKSDGLGSKRWLFYPRASTVKSDPNAGKVAGARDNSDQRIKIDGQFFRKYKRSKSVARDAPIAKLMRWELILYKKLGFIKAE